MNINIHETGINLADIIDRVKAGEEIIITKEETVVQLISIPQPEKKPFPFGILKGMKMVGWDDPLPQDITEFFGMID